MCVRFQGSGTKGFSLLKDGRYAIDRPIGHLILDISRARLVIEALHRFDARLYGRGEKKTGKRKVEKGK